MEAAKLKEPSAFKFAFDSASGTTYDCTLEVTYYRDGGRPALLVVAADTERNRVNDVLPGEELFTASVNIPEREPKRGCIFMKTWSENAGLLEELVRIGAVALTGASVHLGHVVTPEARLLVNHLPELPGQAPESWTRGRPTESINPQPMEPLHLAGLVIVDSTSTQRVFDVAAPSGVSRERIDEAARLAVAAYNAFDKAARHWGVSAVELAENLDLIKALDCLSTRDGEGGASKLDVQRGCSYHGHAKFSFDPGAYLRNFEAVELVFMTTRISPQAGSLNVAEAAHAKLVRMLAVKPEDLQMTFGSAGFEVRVSAQRTTPLVVVFPRGKVLEVAVMVMELERMFPEWLVRDDQLPICTERIAEGAIKIIAGAKTPIVQLSTEEIKRGVEAVAGLAGWHLFDTFDEQGHFIMRFRSDRVPYELAVQFATQ